MFNKKLEEETLLAFEPTPSKLQRHVFKERNVMKIVGRCVGKMGRFGTSEKAVIELFDEKTGDVVRVIHFHKLNEFNEFLKDFKAMRYPGYGWRYIDKGKKKGKNE